MPFGVTSFFHASKVNSTELPYVRLIDLEAKWMQSTECLFTHTGCGGSSGICEACRNLNGGLGPNMYKRGEGLHLATLRGPLCAVRCEAPVDRGLVDPCFFFCSFYSFIFVLYCLFLLSGALVQLHACELSSHPLGLITVASDRFSSPVNMGAYVRKLRCRRLLVPIWLCVNMDLFFVD